MTPEIAQAAETLAHNALVLLAAALTLSALAAAVVLMTVRLASRHQDVLFERVRALMRRLQRVPFVDTAFGHARRLVPSGYLAVHLVIGLIATAAVVAFAILAEEVVAGRMVVAFDHAFADALHGHASPRWQQVFRVVTWFGATEVLLVIAAIIAVPLFRRDRVFGMAWVIGQGGGAALTAALKNAFERTRPEYADAFLLSPSWSFPSGHAMSTFVFCGLGAYLLLRVNPSWTRIVVVTAAALSWCMLMGFTRLYLGVHFLSDVVAGLIAATAWVAVCVSGIEVALRRPRARGYTPRARSRRRARDERAGRRASAA